MAQIYKSLKVLPPEPDKYQEDAKQSPLLWRESRCHCLFAAVARHQQSRIRYPTAKKTDGSNKGPSLALKGVLFSQHCEA
ncbi:hypothetical protein EVAR_101189_1 [Eumeta japonica]|uniref:Uncharacterized protein n=1 Tax=Eumeta variegata TaxID=151549 RepID=A0A4C2A803_EUMVA|nr:hypothetical protein EVAR_101189_1 [Eumeta japonica]